MGDLFLFSFFFLKVLVSDGGQKLLAQWLGKVSVRMQLRVMSVIVIEAGFAVSKLGSDGSQESYG